VKADVLANIGGAGPVGLVLIVAEIMRERSIQRTRTFFREKIF